MMYIDFHAGDKDYKLRLTTRSMITLEKQINCNPLAIFGKGEDIPEVTTMVAILHAALQKYEHGITLDKAYDIFDEYLEDHAMTDFLSVIVDIYKASGLIVNDKKEDETEKN